MGIRTKQSLGANPPFNRSATESLLQTSTATDVSSTQNINRSILKIEQRYLTDNKTTRNTPPTELDADVVDDGAGSEPPKEGRGGRPVEETGVRVGAVTADGADCNPDRRSSIDSRGEDDGVPEWRGLGS